MSDYYTAKRTRNLFNPESTQPFTVSRSKIDLFLNCARCFYLDRRLGVGRPPGFPFNLNSAVDSLLKREFDAHRAANTAHPLMEQYNIDALPFAHPRMDEWRDVWKGVRFVHKETNLEITGAVDDIWMNPDKELIVVDYKATSKNGDVNIDAPWQIGYKRQMEVYQWLLRQLEYPVSSTGYFVYANGKADAAAFDGKLEFDVKVIPYEGNDSWVEKTVTDIRATLESTEVPPAGKDCDFCQYRAAAQDVLGDASSPEASEQGTLI